MGATRKILGTKNGVFDIRPVYEAKLIAPHHHRFFEINYFIRGTGVLHYCGRDWPIRSPQLHFCPPGKPWHGYDGLDGRILHSSMAIYPRLFNALRWPGKPTAAEQLSHASPLALLTYLGQLPSPLIDLKPPSARRARELIELMCEEQRLQLTGYMLRIGACVQELLVLASREQAGLHIHPSVAVSSAHASQPQEQEAFVLDRDPRIANAVSVMRSGVHQRLSNARLAQRVGLGEKYFIRLFTNEVGISPQRYYLRLKLEAAAQYLVNTSLKVSEIAETFGFRHRTHFQVCFKRHFEMTPSLYRYFHRRQA